MAAFIPARRWCQSAPVRRSPVGASMPPTIDPARPGTYRPLPVHGRGPRFLLRRDAAIRGNSGRRPRTFDRTPELAKGGHRRSRSKVTSRATMSYRPRPGTRPAGLIASSSNGSPPKIGRRSSFPGEGTAGDHRRSLEGEAPRVRSMSPSARSRRMYDALAPTPAIGKAPHSPWESPGGGTAGVPAAILRAFPGRAQVTRTGEVLRSRDQGASSVP